MAEGLRHWKNDRDRNTLMTGISLRMHSFPGGRFPAKFGCQPIKLEPYPLARKLIHWKIDDRNTLMTGNRLCVHSFPGGRFPAKFGCLFLQHFASWLSEFRGNGLAVLWSICSFSSRASISVWHCTVSALTVHSHCTHSALTVHSHCTHSGKTVFLQVQISVLHHAYCKR